MEKMLYSERVRNLIYLIYQRKIMGQSDHNHKVLTLGKETDNLGLSNLAGKGIKDVIIEPKTRQTQTRKQGTIF